MRLVAEAGIVRAGQASHGKEPAGSPRLSPEIAAGAVGKPKGRAVEYFCCDAGKRRDLVEYGSKLQFNIAKYKELIHNLELAIKAK
jgi:hypothetical protein